MPVNTEKNERGNLWETGELTGGLSTLLDDFQFRGKRGRMKMGDDGDARIFIGKCSRKPLIKVTFRTQRRGSYSS